MDDLSNGDSASRHEIDLQLAPLDDAERELIESGQLDEVEAELLLESAYRQIF